MRNKNEHSTLISTVLMIKPPRTVLSLEESNFTFLHIISTLPTRDSVHCLSPRSSSANKIRTSSVL
nr:MAG TPA: hypothetical protein [Caudoviricetes sp.]